MRRIRETLMFVGNDNGIGGVYNRRELAEG